MSADYHVLHIGYANEDGVGSSVSLVRDGEAVIIVDPGMVADRALITAPLAAHGLQPADVTHVVLTHHHPDHTLNVGLFPNAEVVDHWARYRADQWLDHEGDGYRVAPNTRIMLTPGHTAEDLTLLVATSDGMVAFTHCWWRSDGSPRQDPLCDDQGTLEASRQRIRAEADVVVPGHGAAFPTGRRVPGPA